MNDQDIHIKIELDLDEVNLLLEALGALPFVRVYKLIGRLQAEATAQVKAERAVATQEASS